MEEDKIRQALQSGAELVLRLDTNNADLEHCITLSQCFPDDLSRYSPRFLQEEPSFVQEQQIIRDKPFKTGIIKFSSRPELGSYDVHYFANLLQVEEFLQQQGKSLEDMGESDTL